MKHHGRDVRLTKDQRVRVAGDIIDSFDFIRATSGRARPRDNATVSLIVGDA